MKILNVIQGTQEWREARIGKFCASDAPTMMGVNPYETRDELIARLATGIEREHSPHTLALFQRGHEAEAKARAKLEAETGLEFYPAVCVSDDGKYLASMDGLTMDGRFGFEHKLWNQKIVNSMMLCGIDASHAVQMTHQFMVTDVSKIYYVMSDGGDNLGIVEVDRSDAIGRQEGVNAIKSGWEQLEKDIEAYKANPPAPKSAPVVADVESVALPVLAINVDGKVAIRTNLDVFGERLRDYIAKINKSPETDQDFADLGATAKELKRVEDALKAASLQVDEAVSVGDIKATITTLGELSRQNRIICEKLEKEGKDARKRAIINEGEAKWRKHIDGFAYAVKVAPDFIGATKGLKTIDSFTNAVNTELARAMIAFNAERERISSNVEYFSPFYKPYGFLFSDLSVLFCEKSNDDFKAIVDSRILAHQAAEAEKEAKRKAEEDARVAEVKAKAEADAQAAIAKAKYDEEARVKEASEKSEAQADIVFMPVQKPQTKASEMRSKLIDFINNASDGDIAKLNRFCNDTFQTFHKQKGE